MPVLPQSPTCFDLAAAIESLPMTDCTLVQSCSLEASEGWKMATSLLQIFGLGPPGLAANVLCLIPLIGCWLLHLAQNHRVRLSAAAQTVKRAANAFCQCLPGLQPRVAGALG